MFSLLKQRSHIIAKILFAICFLGENGDKLMQRCYVTANVNSWSRQTLYVMVGFYFTSLILISSFYIFFNLLIKLLAFAIWLLVLANSNKF